MEVERRLIGYADPENISDCTLGAAAELRATEWLMRRGYQTFRNASPNGPADIIAWKPSTGETLYLDVKWSAKMIRLEAAYGLAVGAYGVEFLLVSDDKGVQFAKDCVEKVSSQRLAATKAREKIYEAAQGYLDGKHATAKDAAEAGGCSRGTIYVKVREMQKDCVTHNVSTLNSECREKTQ